MGLKIGLTIWSLHMNQTVEPFRDAAVKVGVEVHQLASVDEAAAYIAAHLNGTLLYSGCPSLERAGLKAALQAAGVDYADHEFRKVAAAAAGGVTGANFGIAATGTVVVESTDEAIRLATTLPDKHFVLLDPTKILDNADAAVPLMRRFHEQLPQAYLAYLTGPSRTADIERVLTIGVHGPAELHVLLLEGLSGDPLER